MTGPEGAAALKAIGEKIVAERMSHADALAQKDATIDMQSQAITALEAKNADLEAKLSAVTDAVPDAVVSELSSLQTLVG